MLLYVDACLREPTKKRTVLKMTDIGNPIQLEYCMYLYTVPVYTSPMNGSIVVTKSVEFFFSL